MDVLNLIQCTNLGGMEQASLGLMRALQRRDYRFEVLSLNPVGELGPLLAESGVPAHGLDYAGQGGWRIVPQLLRQLAGARPDALLMTGHNLLASLASTVVRSRRSVLAIHFHHEGVKPAWQWRLIYAVACLRFDAITFPTDFIRREAERLYPPVRAKAFTIGNPVLLRELTTESQRRDARSELGLSADVKVVGNAGWLIARKRWDVFLRVAARVKSRVPDAVFLIAGDGELRPSLEALAEQLGIREAIRWLGWQPDLQRFYRSLDVLQFHSDWDALGLTPLEAMSTGVPVVASVKHGGLHEIVRDGTDATLLQDHDIERLSDAVVALLSDSANRERWGLAGRRRVEVACSPEATADGYARLFEAM